MREALLVLVTLAILGCGGKVCRAVWGPEGPAMYCDPVDAGADGGEGDE